MANGVITNGTQKKQASLPIDFLTIIASDATSTAQQLLEMEPFGKGKCYFDPEGVGHERYGVNVEKGLLW